MVDYWLLLLSVRIFEHRNEQQLAEKVASADAGDGFYLGTPSSK
jgi:hypothetical protein